jgi:hypothetical protein
MKRIIFLLVIIVSCYTCKKDNSYNFSPNLTGEWSWISSCGGFAYMCYTPKSTNSRINLVITADSIFSSFKNDTLISSVRFRVHKLISTDTKDTTNVIEYDSQSQWFSIKHDTLNLNDFCCDRFYSKYKRIR